MIRHGGKFIEGSGLVYNASSIVAYSVARVRFHPKLPIWLRSQMRNNLGNSGYLRQLQLSPWASWVPTREGG